MILAVDGGAKNDFDFANNLSSLKTVFSLNSTPKYLDTKNVSHFFKVLSPLQVKKDSLPRFNFWPERTMSVLAFVEYTLEIWGGLDLKLSKDNVDYSLRDIANCSITGCESKIT